MIEKKKQSLFLILDTPGLIYRSFYALPEMNTSTGLPTNAIYGFYRMWQRIEKEHKPDFIAACFDYPAPTFRDNIYREYKAHRPKIPEKLLAQISPLKELLECLNIAIMEYEGYEADDLIGTLAREGEKNNLLVLIVSGDLDVLQLVSANTRVLISRKGITDITIYDEEKVKERFGIASHQLPDFKALKGDPSDNIPGVPGIGEKTASRLIKEFDSLENLLQNLEKLKADKIKNLLIKYKTQAIMGKDLSLISVNVPLQIDWENLRYHLPNMDKLKKLLKRLEFKSLLNKLDEKRRGKEVVTEDTEQLVLPVLE